MEWTQSHIEHFFDTDDNFKERYCNENTIQNGGENLTAMRLLAERLAILMPNGGHTSPGFRMRPCPWLAISYPDRQDLKMNGKWRVAVFQQERKFYIGFRCKPGGRTLNDLVQSEILEAVPTLNRYEWRKFDDPNNDHLHTEINIPNNGIFEGDNPLANEQPLAMALLRINRQYVNIDTDFLKLYRNVLHFFNEPADSVITPRWYKRFLDSKVRPPDFPKYDKEIIDPEKVVIIKPDTKMTLSINTILYGPPGTGKTFSTTALALSVLTDFEDAGAYVAKVQDGAYAAAPKTDRWRKWIDRFEDLRKAGRVEVTTFHQNYSYEDFVEGLRAKVVTNIDTDTKVETTSVAYEIEPGIFKRIAYRAMYAWLTGTAPEADAEVTKVVDAWLGDGKEPDQKRAAGAKAPPYVLIIDEINRGNMSRILGELITLLEGSKRAKAEDDLISGDQPMAATLAYTKKPFMVPPNLYIIGTMNTADRSLVGLDLALRRRFSFVELEPHPKALCAAIPGPNTQESLNLQSFLQTLNERIESELDREHTIGHAFLCGVSDMAGLQRAMQDKVIPQLIEYFHDAPPKLQRVLGNSGFVSFSDNRPVRIKGINRIALGEIDSYLRFFQ